MKTILIFFITVYQKLFSLDTGFLPKIFGFSKPVCMFYPTCSEYMKQAIQKHGLIHGIRLGLLRIAKCNPKSTPGVDLVPEELSIKE